MRVERIVGSREPNQADDVIPDLPTRAEETGAKQMSQVHRAARIVCRCPPHCAGRSQIGAPPPTHSWQDSFGRIGVCRLLAARSPVSPMCCRTAYITISSIPDPTPGRRDSICMHSSRHPRKDSIHRRRDRRIAPEPRLPSLRSTRCSRPPRTVEGPDPSTPILAR